MNDRTAGFGTSRRPVSGQVLAGPHDRYGHKAYGDILNSDLMIPDPAFPLLQYAAQACQMV
jgi:hypothetical protein